MKQSVLTIIVLMLLLSGSTQKADAWNETANLVRCAKITQVTVSILLCSDQLVSSRINRSGEQNHNIESGVTLFPTWQTRLLASGCRRLVHHSIPLLRIIATATGGRIVAVNHSESQIRKGS
jgi:hypothetical protein